MFSGFDKTHQRNQLAITPISVRHLVTIGMSARQRHEVRLGITTGGLLDNAMNDIGEGNPILKFFR